MIEKIISGGQTGADQAALDAAIGLDIPHGGWIPKGRITEDGPLPSKYNLVDMPTKSYPERTKKNILESDGTLIFSHGKLTGGSAYTRKIAKQHANPCLHINLDNTGAFMASTENNDWLNENDIKILNVAGARGSKDPLIYEKVMFTIERVYLLNLTESNIKDSPSYSSKLWFDNDHPTDMPKTVDEVAEDIINSLDQSDKFFFGNLKEEVLEPLGMALEVFIRQQLEIWSVNEELKQSCIQIARDEGLDESNPPKVIIKRIWQKLRETHKLRVVK
jgi:hypothetical protein